MADRQPAGFTLLEVLIAFLIAAFALAALFRAAVVSETGTAAAARYQEALARARSRLAVQDATVLAAGDQQGDDGGGFRWRVRTQPLTGAGPAGAGGIAPPPAPPLLFAVSVAISWDDGGRARSVQLDTRRLGTAPPRPQ